MSFKSSGPKTRPSRVKPIPPTPSPPRSPSRRLSSTSTTSTSSNENTFHDAHFPPEEECTMLEASNTLKASANAQFASADYSSAIGTYDKALAELPSYLDYELAVLQSNIAACHVKMEEWKSAIEACERGLEGLEREMPTKPKTKGKGEGKRKKKDSSSESKAGAEPSSLPNGHTSDTDSDTDTTHPPTTSDAQVIELPPDATDAELQTHLQTLQLSDTKRQNITRIRSKLLLRRARANTSLTPPTYTSLSAAQSDYTALSTPDLFSILPVSDQKTVRQALVSLPVRVEEAKKREVDEMMGKLKEVGNGILGRFGLSTDMFKMVQGEGGGWSVNFDQGGGAGGSGGGGGDGAKTGSRGEQDGMSG